MNRFLKRCMDLARMAGNQTGSNPLVGAVVVHRGEIIGEGFHEKFGGPHAEVNAIQSVMDKSLLADSELYVSLEPCNHHGKTPPCTQLILENKIPKVMIGCADPNPLVSGTGAEKLRKQGVKVAFAKDPEPFILLNKKFFVNQHEKRAYVTLKWAESADGFIAGKDSEGNPSRVKISCASSDHFVHRLRSEHQAILVGKNTVMVDDPLLNLRHYPGKDPVRMVLDRELEIPRTLKIFRGEGSLIVLNEIRSGTEGNILYHKIQANPMTDPGKLMQEIYTQLGISSVLIEGGRKVLNSFLNAGVYDEVWKIQSPLHLERGIDGPSLPKNFVFGRSNKTGSDLIFHFQRKFNF